jgi:hypothetical protein
MKSLLVDDNNEISVNFDVLGGGHMPRGLLAQYTP